MYKGIVSMNSYKEILSLKYKSNIYKSNNNYKIF